MRRRLVGSFPRQTSRVKERIDFLLTRTPSLYLSIERRRKWINWDKQVYLLLVRRGQLVFDVGANIGAHSVFLSHLVGSTGRVFAYEPIPDTFEALRRTLRARCRFENVIPRQFALGNAGNQERRVTMQVPGGDFTQAALTRHSADSWRQAAAIASFDVPYTTLDDEVTSKKPRSLDFIKIDVEGGELAVIAGGRNAITTFRPFIYCEVYDKWARSFNYQPSDLFSLVYSLGYIGARVFHGDAVDAADIRTEPPAEWFAKSADVLFFAEPHREAVERLDRRFGVAPARGSRA